METKPVSEQERNERILRSREFIYWQDVDYESDQMLRRPQPPLVKEPMTDNVSKLPRNFEDLNMEKDLIRLLAKRRSQRVYTGESMTKLQLSFLLWACQGVKGIRGKKYATLRTVPSGGARHPFETYLYVKNVEGMEPGLYHYLPMEHEIELLQKQTEGMDEQAGKAICDQKWGLKANVIFYFSITPYRGEWRYAFDAHRVMMIDAGHVTENLYLGCGALGLGTCAIAACDSEAGNSLFGIEGTEEYIFYAAPVGTVSDANEDDEQAFYAFLKEED